MCVFHETVYIIYCTSPEWEHISAVCDVVDEPTMVNDALVEKFLHDPDGRFSFRCFFVLNQPINNLLGHKAVWVGAEMMPPVFDHFTLMESQPGKQHIQMNQIRSNLLQPPSSHPHHLTVGNTRHHNLHLNNDLQTYISGAIPFLGQI